MNYKMKDFLGSNFQTIKKEILFQINKIERNELNYNLILSEIIYLSILTECLLFKKKYKNVNPLIVLEKNLSNFVDKIIHINQFKDFSNSIKIKKNNISDINKKHHFLFNKIWSIYNYSEYKFDRVTRYEKRIQINKLNKYIKNSNVVDFGCGHGNFLNAMCKYNLKSGTGIDFGYDNIKYSKIISKKLKNDSILNFKKSNVVNTNLKSDYYDFGIQNGVFHHLSIEDEYRAYLELNRVLKKGAYCWIYTDGGGGIRDFFYDLVYKILLEWDKNFILNFLKSYGLSTSKIYHFSDNFNAKYRHYDLKQIKNILKNSGFKFIKQLNGSFETDFDKPFKKIKFFNEKFGSGDLRLLFQKI